ncbi:MAG TPA: hypothetical protein VH985_21755 [Candidatus Binatia bacterium]|jgi:hypothetical protein
MLRLHSPQVNRCGRGDDCGIPIIVAGAGDLVGMGLAASLARPGSNVKTEFSSLSILHIGEKVQ